MKYFLIALISLISVINVYAQNDATVTGRIIDEGTDIPLPFASIVIQSGNQMVTGAISDDDGRFIFSGLEMGEYNVKVSFIGYVIKNVPLTIGELNDNFDLGKIMLFPSSEQLDEVTIRAQREAITADFDTKIF